MTTSNPTVGALVSATVYVLLSAVLTAAQPAPAGPTGMTPETKQVGVQIGLGGLLGVPVVNSPTTWLPRTACRPT